MKLFLKYKLYWFESNILFSMPFTLKLTLDLCANIPASCITESLSLWPLLNTT